MTAFFKFTLCGVISRNGCGGRIPLYRWLYYRGITVKDGMMFHMFEAEKEFACPHCGRMWKLVFLPCDGLHNMTSVRKHVEITGRM